MAAIRSLLFLLILVVVTPPYTLGVLLCWPLPHHLRRRSVVPWVNFVIWLVKHLLGIPYRLIGAENLPTRPVVVLAKHQSAWETLVLQEIFKDTVFVWKKEIKYLPFFGWALAATPMIETDRSATKVALKRLVDQGRDRLANGYTVIIFPEGTRSQPGSKPLQGRRRPPCGGDRHAGGAGGAQLRRVLGPQRAVQAQRHRHRQHRPGHRSGGAKFERSAGARRNLDRRRDAAHQPATLRSDDVSPGRRAPQLNLRLDADTPDPAQRWHDGAELAYLGSSLRLALGSTEAEARHNGDTLALPLPPQATPRQIQDRAEAWLREEATRLLQEVITQKSALAARRVRRAWRCPSPPAETGSSRATATPCAATGA
jgi:1-acyl-sn-glycerol-3-phosphate acyltransferase